MSVVAYGPLFFFFDMILLCPFFGLEFSKKQLQPSFGTVCGLLFINRDQGQSLTLNQWLSYSDSFKQSGLFE